MDDTAPESGWPGQDLDHAVLIASRLKERLYATITMIAVVVGLAHSGHAGPRGAAVSVAVTAVGLWLTSIVADGQAHRVMHGPEDSGRQLRQTLFVSSPLLLSAVGPLVLIALSALGAMELRTALLTAAGVSVGVLFAWGWYGGVRMGAHTAVALLAGVADAAIGTVVALVKAAGH
ncbi:MULTISPECIES: hypothetical protein [Streptomyces]|uniref:Integral membrane protein n=2 Tax=Streptomyces TaxID=1883 RepID=A0ABW7TCF3_9ACTN|nr:hypothetical protein [Streptomyces luteoverticillatus]